MYFDLLSRKLFSRISFSQKLFLRKLYLRKSSYWRFFSVWLNNRKKKEQDKPYHDSTFLRFISIHSISSFLSICFPFAMPLITVTVCHNSLHSTSKRLKYMNTLCHVALITLQLLSLYSFVLQLMCVCHVTYCTVLYCDTNYSHHSVICSPHTHTHTYTHTHTDTYTFKPTQTHTYTYAYAYIHTPSN